MTAFTYRTIEKASAGLYKEKGSKFLSFAYPVNDESGIKVILDSLRKEYYDARHHCFAWVLGPERAHYRAFDGGEPNHSAGDPILGQIRSRELTDVLVVVIRYFGGVKLGVGGLIQAYKAAAEDALNKTIVVNKEVTEIVDLLYDYASTPQAMRLVKDFDLQVLLQDFTEQCMMRCAIRMKMKNDLLERIQLMQATGTAINIKHTGTSVQQPR